MDLLISTSHMENLKKQLKTKDIRNFFLWKQKDEKVGGVYRYIYIV